MATSQGNEGPSEQFIREITGCQGRLYAYILTLLPDLEMANDVLQETNLAIWRKWREFTEGTNFHAWICRIAYYEVLTYRRNSARDRHLFDEEMVSTLARAATKRTSENRRVLALRRCLERLKASQRELIHSRYGEPQADLESIATSLGTTTKALIAKLYRIRQVLQDCVKRAMAVQH